MSGKGPSQATLLVELALEEEIELFHTPDGEGFVTIPAATHRETWPLRGGPFRRWLARVYYAHGKAAPGSQALQDALGVLEGQALFQGLEHEVHLRLAEHEGAIYLDLADDDWRVVKITASGWEIVQEPPIRFRRARGMRPLPTPAAGGSADELREFVNVADEDWPLLAAWEVAALRPRGPFPVLPIHGEQGSAKSTAARVLRELIDPNAAPLRSEPRDGRDLMIAASNGWILSFDNVSHLPPWLSDAICRLATGGGFATRELYSDMDEVLIDVQRPVVMNGIEELAVRGDLLDRSVILYLPRITHYRPEDEFWAAFARARPRILGGLLDAVVAALANVDRVELARARRMADFAKWAVAAESALGTAPRTFLDAYAGNRADANELTLEASPVAQPLRTLAEAGFEGTATDLLKRLADLVDDEVVRQKSWPKTARSLAGTLRRLAPNLRGVGVDVEFDRTGSKRLIRIRTGPEFCVTTVTTVTDGLEKPLSDDGDDANDGDDAKFPTHSNGPRGAEGRLTDDQLELVQTGRIDDLRRAHEEGRL